MTGKGEGALWVIAFVSGLLLSATYADLYFQPQSHILPRALLELVFISSLCVLLILVPYMLLTLYRGLVQRKTKMAHVLAYLLVVSTILALSLLGILFLSLI